MSSISQKLIGALTFALLAALLLPVGNANAEFIHLEPKFWWQSSGWTDTFKEYKSPDEVYQGYIGFFSTTPPNISGPDALVFTSMASGNALGNITTVNGRINMYTALGTYHQVANSVAMPIGLRFECPVDGLLEDPLIVSNANVIYRCRVDVKKTDFCPQCAGNPIQITDGVKVQREVDYPEVLPGGVSFVRQIRSDQPKFVHNYSDVLADMSVADLTQIKPKPDLCYMSRIRDMRPYAVANNPYCFPYMEAQSAYVRNADGRTMQFIAQPDGSFIAKAPFNSERLRKVVDPQGAITAWTRISGNDEETTFDTNGRMLAIRDRAGRTQRLTYVDKDGAHYPADAPVCTPPAAGQQASVPDTLQCVTDQYGKQLNFFYSADKRMTSMVDPAGAVYVYAYNGPTAVMPANSAIAAELLTSVQYPDGFKRLYHYNEPAFTPQLNAAYSLTGISDELAVGQAVRFAIFNYDATGRAISTEHAGGVERYGVAYDQANFRGTITNPLGGINTQSYVVWTGGVVKLASETQPAGAGSAAASSARTYDANGNLASKTDFNGSVTNYTYDLNRNLETRRVEAAGTAQARTISTEWHALHRLPVRVAEPLRMTTFTYDAKANLIAKTETATADASGLQGFTAASTGVARTWTYTWNDAGLLLTATGPRSDIADVTTYAYDDRFNLVSVTNAAGHITRMSNYDGNGRVGRIVDPNGLITDFSYSPRGWLTAKNVGGEVTTYAYDGAGQLTQVGLPDASTIAYTYDAAHRLINIADSVGNTIAYTLDPMGNRVTEQVRDSGGALARQISRVYDVLSRLQQVTGATQ